MTFLIIKLSQEDDDDEPHYSCYDSFDSQVEAWKTLAFLKEEYEFMNDKYELYKKVS